MSEGTWEKFSQVAVKGAEYDSRERQPHPKCLEGTRAVLLNHIYGLSDAKDSSRLIWLHGTAGVGKSAVAFTVAERMRGLKMTDETKVETRLGGTFFFSRKHTKRRTTGYFFVTLAYQLALNFPSVQSDVNKAILKNPALLDPDTPLRKQMEGLFLQPLRKLQFRLRECPPLMFVVDALDECTSESVDQSTSESELADLISLLGEALREADLPVIHILITSRSEEHIRKAMQTKEMCSLVLEIPVKISGDGVTTTISLDGADVDNDIYIFLKHSFRDLESRHPDFPQPSTKQLTRLASRAGRRFIVASTMVKFIDDPEDDPRDRLQLMLMLTSALLPGTEVYKLYDRILSTCADPTLAYLHLSVVAALADPLPISQISKLLGPSRGRDVERVLIQLRSIIDVPTDSSLPVNIYHSSVRDYVSHRSNCSLRQVRYITSPHSLLAHSSLRLMMQDLPDRSVLLDALLALKRQSRVMESCDPQRLTHSLSFIVQPPEPMQVLVTLLWLRGYHRSELQIWLQTQDGRAWLKTLDGRAWLQTQGGKDWLQTQMSQSSLHICNWLQTQRGKNLVPPNQTIAEGRESFLLYYEQNSLQSLFGQDGLPTQHGQSPLQTQSAQHQPLAQHGQSSLKTRSALHRLPTQHGQNPLQSRSAQPRLLTQREQSSLQVQFGRRQLLTQPEPELLLTRGRNNWLQTQRGRDWVQTHVGKDWVWTQGGQDWLQTRGGKDWLQTRGGKHWVQTHGGPDWLQTNCGRQWLQTLGGQDWLQTLGGQDWLQTHGGRDWLQTHGGQDWLPTRGGNKWLQTPSARDWLQAPDGRDWLQTPQGQMWRLTTVWVTMEEFSNTLEAIKHHIIIPELSSQSAFQVIQQFRSLPDFLMFPVFLALRHQDHSTPALIQYHLPPDMEIIYAMKAFSDFANKACERSRSASDALNYACHNWAVHISRVPKPWDEKLAHMFRSFWDCHLLDWLERQWCAKGLQSCLTILSEGGKIAEEHLLQTPSHLNKSEAVGFSESETPTKEHLLRIPGHLSSQSESVGSSERGKPTKEHLIQTPGHLNSQSEAVGFSEGEKPVKEHLLQIPGHLSDQSEAVGCMQHLVLFYTTFLRMFKC